MRRPQLAIYVKKSNTAHWLFTEIGTWCNVAYKEILFTVPGFIQQYTLRRLESYLPGEEMVSGPGARRYDDVVSVPRHIGGRILSHLRTFRERANTIARNHALDLDRAQAIFSNAHNDTYETKSLEDMALIIFQKSNRSELTPEMLFAIHNEINHQWTSHAIQPMHRLGPRFGFLEQSIIDDNDQVARWIRQYQANLPRLGGFEIGQDTMTDNGEMDDSNPLYSFIENVRGLIVESRQRRQLSKLGHLGPVPVGHTIQEDVIDSKCGHKRPFTDDELKFVAYLQRWTVKDKSYQNPELRSLCCTLLRLTGMYDDYDLKPSHGATLLQEIGIFKPWAYSRGNDIIIDPPHHDLETQISVLRERGWNSWPETPLEDSMVAWRKDWGDLPVFCIDNAQTKEVDDGISLQADEADPSASWIHVHVANPSAFLQPTSPVSLYAQAVLQTFYLPDKFFSMLPPTLAQDKFSLRRDRPCITFTAKVSDTGEILEQTVSHGIVHNVYQLSPGEVDRLLGYGDQKTRNEQSSVLIHVEGAMGPTKNEVPSLQPSEPTDQNPLGAKEIQILRKLTDVADKLKASQGVIYSLSTTTRQSTRTTVEVVLPNHMTGSPQDEGDPAVTVRRENLDHLVTPGTVQEMMVLAGRVCAEHCAQRGIPIIYRGTMNEPGDEKHVQKLLKTQFEPYFRAGRQDEVPQEQLKLLYKLLGTSVISSNPRKHGLLMANAYCQATSPLRRYSDLLAHWQLEAALRYEHETGNVFVGTSPDMYGGDRPILPFTEPQVRDLAIAAWRRERIHADRARLSRREWTCYALFRAFYFDQAALPDFFRATVTMLTPGWDDFIRAEVSDWQLLVQMVPSDLTRKLGGFRVGDVWDVKILQISPAESNIHVDPINLVRRSQKEDNAEEEGDLKLKGYRHYSQVSRLAKQAT